MPGVRFLSLLALVATLFVARLAVSTDASFFDRAELPTSGGGGDNDGSDGDAGDLILPLATTLIAHPSPARRHVFEAERAPATSAFAAPIFRPPISVLA